MNVAGTGAIGLERTIIKAQNLTYYWKRNAILNRLLISVPITVAVGRVIALIERRLTARFIWYIYNQCRKLVQNRNHSIEIDLKEK
jgi:hypothetical protein